MSESEVKDDWRSRVKDLFATKCTPISATSKPVQTQQRYSLDLDPEFKKMLLKAPQFAQINEKEELIDQAVNNNFDKPSYEEVEKKEDKICEIQNKNTRFVVGNVCELASDDSFEEIEKMCNETISDPLSTSFKYLQYEHKDVVPNAENVFIDPCSSLTTDIGAIERNVNSLCLADNQTPTSKKKFIICEENKELFDYVDVPSPFNHVNKKGPISTREDNKGSLKSSYKTATFAMQNVSSNDYKNVNRESVGSIDSALKPLHVNENYKNTARISEEISIQNQFANKIVVKSEYDFHVSPLSFTLKNSRKNKIITTIQEQHASGIEKKKNLNDSIIVVSDDDAGSDDNKQDKQQFKEVKERTFSNLNQIISKPDKVTNAGDNDNEDKENSFQGTAVFNDTLEEVSHILELLEKNGKPNAIVNSNLNLGGKAKKISPQPLKIRQNTFTIPTKKNLVEPPKAVKTPLAKFTKVVNRVNTTNSPKTTSALSNSKAKIFKTPNTRRIEIKANKSSGCNNKQFAHIISPIGTYIKKSGTVPLITTHSLKTSNSTPHAVNRELDFVVRSAGKEQLNNVPVVARALPKKAYISSDLKHYVDERTPVTIPEVSKVKNYIETARLPAVMRHDGKYKMPISAKTFDSSPKSTKNYSQAKKASLANLSVTTGDVSLYTIKDAQIL